MKSANDTLEFILQEPPEPARVCVIWLHGLGADGHDFAGISQELSYPHASVTRFIFPHAPIRPVTLNAGMPMRAWYDILGLAHEHREDEAGLTLTQAHIHTLIDEQIQAGIEPQNIFLAGFSQGGASALYCGLSYPQPLAGIIGLSCYLPLAEKALASNKQNNTPIFLGHGMQDQVVQFAWGEESMRLLKAKHSHLTWKTYPIEHTVCLEEIQDIAQFMTSALR